MPESIRHKEEHLAIENIFGKPPGWILHWGITVGFLFLLVCLGVAAFVKYPDKLQMQGQLLATNKPISVFSKTDCIIEDTYVVDKSMLSAGNLVFTLKSTLDKNDLDEIQEFATKFTSILHKRDYASLKIPGNLILGELTPTYSLINKSFKEFQHFLKDETTSIKVNALEKEIVQMDRLNHSLGRQGEYYESDLALTEKNYQRNLTLQKEGVIAPVDKEKIESRLINERRNLEAFKTNIINNDLRIQQLKTQIAEITAKRRNEYNNKIFTINQLLEQFQGQIREWEDKHKVISPIDGLISFTQNWAMNQFVKAGVPLFTIIPDYSDQDYFVEGLLPIRASGSLKLGQSSIVEIVNYPSGKYGVIKGVVSDISLIPTEDNYRVTVKLAKDLITNYKKELPNDQLMKANVSINTQDYSLLERIFQNILDVTQNRNQ